MKKLLIVTDHRFYGYDNDVYDNYVFDYSFFKDYLVVFDHVTIVGRVERLNSVPHNYLKTTGPNLTFIEVDDKRGLSWFFLNRKIVGKSPLKISEYDAICYRIPSVLCFSIWKMAKENKKPHMFEMIGHPAESLQFAGSYFKKFILKLIGRSMHLASKNLVQTAVCGSYVTFNSLQRTYPINQNALSFPISSIRLEDKYILNEIKPFNSSKILIVHVGSFVPVKNHDYLLDFVNKVKDYYDVKLTFLGGGNLLDSMKEKVKVYKLENIVVFKGHIVGFENIVRELDKNNVFILPSHSEGMPRAMIEAMARGLVCFGSNRGGIAELLTEDYIFDPLDVNTLIHKFENCLKNSKKINDDRINNLEKAQLFEKSKLTGKRIKLLTFLRNQIDE